MTRRDMVLGFAWLGMLWALLLSSLLGLILALLVLHWSELWGALELSNAPLAGVAAFTMLALPVVLLFGLWQVFPTALIEVLDDPDGVL